jgi:N-glycosylase/DNA lyase
MVDLNEGDTKMDTLVVQDFDLAASLGSGQVFHWHAAQDKFAGLVGDRLLVVSQPDPGRLLVSPGGAELARDYFALDHDLPMIRATLPADDEHLRRAVQYASGLRILRQPRWECLASFITSSLKQVAHIRQISLLLRRRFGRRMASIDGVEFFSYPTPRALAEAGETALRECGLGYRAKFLHQTAALIANGGLDLDSIADLDDAAALEKLVALPGVGPKIAQCALLFAWERLGVFPIDVWIERALRELYFSKKRRAPSSKDLRRFAEDHFGPYRGYAQQWLFHHARTGGIFPRRRKRG